jgi:hypothetical protein
MTWFNPRKGTCGWKNRDSDMVVALSSHQWDGRSHCGHWVRITTPSGTTARAQVVDGCKGYGEWALDASPALFITLFGDLEIRNAKDISYEFV